MSKFSTFKKSLANKDIKQLIENFFSLSILKIFNLILPFVTLPYLIKTLGFEQYGAIVMALALIQYFRSFTDYGFNFSATRDIARHRHSKRQLGFIYSKVMASKFILLIFSLCLILPIVFFIPQFKDDRLVFLLMLSVLFGHTLFPEWFFRGVEKMRYIVFLDLFIKLFFTVGVFIFINKPGDYWIYPLLNGIGYSLVAFSSYFLIKKHFSVNFYFVGFEKVKLTLKNGFPLFLNQFSPNLYNNSTGLIIGFFLGNYFAGIFGSVRRVTDLLSVFNAVVISVVFPYLNRNINKFKVFSLYYLVFYFLISLFFSIIFNFILKYLGILDFNYLIAGLVLIFGLFFRAVYSVYATNYLIIIGEDYLVMRLTVFCSVLGMLSSLFMISFFGVLGGAINIAMVQFLLGALAFFYYLKHRNI